MSSKEKPVLNRSDIIELYDRSAVCLTDLLAIACDKNFEIEISIDPSGKISFKTCEFTEDRTYVKEQIVSSDYIGYHDYEMKRNKE